MAGLLARLMGRGVSGSAEMGDNHSGVFSDFWYTPTSGVFRSGNSSDSAMSLPAVYACVRIISETIATLPKTICKLQESGAIPDKSHPAYRWFSASPNNWQTSVEFWELMCYSLCLRGNAYAQKFDTDTGLVTIPLHPDRVEPFLLNDGFVYYKVKRADGTSDVVLPDEMLHVRGLSDDGIKGMSPIEMEKRSIDLSISLDKHGLAVFENGTAPGGIIEVPGKLTDAKKKELRDATEARHQGASKANRVMVLDQGLKWTTVAVSQQDSQWLESKKYQATDICRIFRVPQHMIGILERSTNNNIEHQGIEFVQHTIRPNVVRIEEAIQRDIIGDENYEATFDIDDLLRGDYYSRMQGLQIEFQNGAISQNEWRRSSGRVARSDLEAGKYYINRSLISTDQSTSLTEQQIAGAMGVPNEAQPKNPNGRPAKSGAVAAWAADISSRLAAATLRELNKRTKHRESDRGKFAEFLVEHMSSRVEYTSTAIAPLFQFAGVQDVSDIAESICQSTAFAPDADYSKYAESLEVRILAAIDRKYPA